MPYVFWPSAGFLPLPGDTQPFGSDDGDFYFELHCGFDLRYASSGCEC